MTHWRIPAFLAVAAVAALPSVAQLAEPNASGVRMGHIHLYVRDAAAQQRFWTLLGGTAVRNQKLEMIQFPGVYIVLRQAEPAGPPAGSIVNHFGLVWKNLPSAMATWKANGLKIEQEENPNQGYVIAPDGIRVEFFGDPKIQHAVEMNHIHFFPAGVAAMQAWYAKVFGGVAGKRARVVRPGWIDCVDVPGVNLSMSPSNDKTAPTAGRSLDHIGFEVTNLPEFLKRLEGMGIRPDEALRPSQNSTKLRVAFISDPWGTKIELTEGLAP
jgi:catechol 2,3-dioxygenase-like lactoylglutathione lyase family enzyme